MRVTAATATGDGQPSDAATATPLIASPPTGCDTANDVWCAELTAGERSSNIVTVYGYWPANNVGSLTRDTFNYAGKTFTVQQLLTRTVGTTNSQLTMNLDLGLSELGELFLYVGDNIEVGFNANGTWSLTGDQNFTTGTKYLLRISKTESDIDMVLEECGRSGWTLVVNKTLATNDVRPCDARSGNLPITHTFGPKETYGLPLADLGLTFDPVGLVGAGAPTRSQPQTTYVQTATDADTDTREYRVTVQPAKPAAPTVTKHRGQLTLTWPKPADAGITRWEHESPANSGQWSEISPTESTSGSVTTLSHTITGLTDDTTYTPVAADVSYYLRATASYDDGHGTGKTTVKISDSAVATGSGANNPPLIGDSDPVSRSVAENTATGTNLGAALSATDQDTGDTLSWSLTGAGSSLFAIDSSGQITVAGTLDHEYQSNHSITATVSDGNNGADSVTVNITVTNEEEPGTVTLNTQDPVVGEPVRGRLGDPDGTVPPRVWKWYRSTTGNPGTWGSEIGVGDTYTPVSGDVGHSLRVYITYTDNQGPGKSTEAVTANQVVAAPSDNQAPVIGDSDPVARSVPENSASGTNLGAALSATDADGDALTWSLIGTGSSLFAIDANGQMSVNGALDYETTASYSLTATVSDVWGSSDTVAVNVTVADSNEPPGKVATPTVASASTTSLTVTWSAPDITGKSAIDDYDVRYKLSTASSWTNEPANTADSTATTRTLTGLAPASQYDVQVRAENDEGDGAWSDTATGTLVTNNPPGMMDPSTLAHVTGQDTHLSVSWTAPADNGGAAIDDYDVQYKLATDSSWTGEPAGTPNSTNTSGTLTGLTAHGQYEVQVRAGNSAGKGPWSDAFTGWPGENRAPVISDATRSVDEDASNGANVSNPVTATDDAGNTVPTPWAAAATTIPSPSTPPPARSGPARPWTTRPRPATR